MVFYEFNDLRMFDPLRHKRNACKYSTPKKIFQCNVRPNKILSHLFEKLIGQKQNYKFIKSVIPFLKWIQEILSLSHILEYVTV